MYVAAGSTMVTPASIQRWLMRRRRAASASARCTRVLMPMTSSASSCVTAIDRPPFARRPARPDRSGSTRPCARAATPAGGPTAIPPRKQYSPALNSISPDVWLRSVWFLDDCLAPPGSRSDTPEAARHGPRREQREGRPGAARSRPPAAASRPRPAACRHWSPAPGRTVPRRSPLRLPRGVAGPQAIHPAPRAARPPAAHRLMSPERPMITGAFAARRVQASRSQQQACPPAGAAPWADRNAYAVPRPAANITVSIFIAWTSPYSAIDSGDRGASFTPAMPRGWAERLSAAGRRPAPKSRSSSLVPERLIVAHGRLGRQDFEPGSTDPKSGVLPLHYAPRAPLLGEVDCNTPRGAPALPWANERCSADRSVDAGCRRGVAAVWLLRSGGGFIRQQSELAGLVIRQLVSARGPHRWTRRTAFSQNPSGSCDLAFCEAASRSGRIASGPADGLFDRLRLGFRGRLGFAGHFAGYRLV